MPAQICTIPYSQPGHWWGKTPLPGLAHLPTICPMLDYRSIHFITDEERAAIAASRREENDLAYQRELDPGAGAVGTRTTRTKTGSYHLNTHQASLYGLDQWERESEQGGRPSIVLPPEIARRVLADLEAGLSHRTIELKYRGTRYPFSRRWLVRAIADGR